ncbi:MAG: virion core protein, partial [Massilioclostridium sp.]|nr:virion core protein [Massilioclostridium sp.]
EAEQKAQQGWSCSCGQTGNTGKFCSNCGKPKPAPAGSWKCPSCGSENIGRFCGECGTKKPEAAKCANCGFVPADGSAPKFCPECGKPFAG